VTAPGRNGGPVRPQQPRGRRRRTGGSAPGSSRAA
jgi:hypothetical protein